MLAPARNRHAHNVQLKLEPPPRVAVLPLGTGNDLSLSFGWGNAFLPSWLRNFGSVYNMLRRVADAQPRELDCWRITMSAGEAVPSPTDYAQNKQLLPARAQTVASHRHVSA